MVTVTIAPFVRVVIPGRPPSLNARYGHYMARARDVAMWKRRARLLAQSARAEAHWPLPVRTDPPVTRWLEIDTYRIGELDPLDNLPGSLKAILDGLTGALTAGDGSKWVRLVRPITPHRVATAAEERTEIVVWREDPNTPEETPRG